MECGFVVLPEQIRTTEPVMPWCQTVQPERAVLPDRTAPVSRRRRSPAPGGRLGGTRGLELSPWSVFLHECCRYPWIAEGGIGRMPEKTLGTLAAAVDLAASRLAPVLAPARPPRPGARLGGRRLDNAALAAYLTNAKQGRQRSFWGIVDSSTFTGNTLSPSDRAMRYRLMYCHSASIWMVSQYFGV